MATIYAFALIVFLVGVVLLLGSLLVEAKLHVHAGVRHTIIEAFKHIGIAGVVSAIIIVVVDARMEEHLAHFQFKSSLRQAVKDNAAEAQKVESVFVNNPIRFSDYQIHARLDKAVGYVVYSWKADYKVTNISSTPVPFSFKPSVSSDVPQFAKSDLTGGSITRSTDKFVILSDSAFKKLVSKDSIGSEYIATLDPPKVFELDPGEVYDVTVSYSSHDRETAMTIHIIKEVTRGAEYWLSYIPADFEVNIYRASTKELYGTPIHFDIDPARHIAKEEGPFALDDVVLPFQGFRINWQRSTN